MILQINKCNKRIYQEAECITLNEIDLSETSGYSKNDLIEILNLEVNPENRTYFDMDDVLSDDEKLKKEKMIKVAVLSDGEVFNNNRTLIFSGNTTLYLLNNSGKTIQRF